MIVAPIMFGLCALALPAQAQQGAPSTVPVGTVSAELKPIARATDFVGRIEAIAAGRDPGAGEGLSGGGPVQGGRLVKEGAPLYRIEKGLFQADVEQAQGALERSKAAHTLAVVQLQRARGAAGQERRHCGRPRPGPGAEQQTNGAISTDEANLMTAQDQPRLYRHRLRRSAAGSAAPASPRAMSSGPDSGVLTVDRQPGPDVCDASRSASASSCACRERATAIDRKQAQGRDPVLRRDSAYARRPDQFRRRDGRSHHRHGAGARRHAQSRQAC